MPDELLIDRMITDALDETARLARAGQQVIDIADGVNHLGERLTDLYEREPDLGPEILAAMTALRDCGEALGRVLTANSAFVDARRERLFNPEEGGPS